MKKLEFEVCLLETNIWKKIEITENHLMNTLHILLQEAFELTYKHVYEFEIDNKVYFDFRLNEIEDILSLENEDHLDGYKNIEKKNYFNDNKIKIEELNLKVGDVLQYTYNFDEPMEFELVVKKVKPVLFSYLKIVDGSENHLPDGIGIELYKKITSDKMELDDNEKKALEFLLENEKSNMKETNKILKEIKVGTLVELDDVE